MEPACGSVLRGWREQSKVRAADRHGEVHVGRLRPARVHHLNFQQGALPLYWLCGLHRGEAELQSLCFGEQEMVLSLLPWQGVEEAGMSLLLATEWPIKLTSHAQGSKLHSACVMGREVPGLLVRPVTMYDSTPTSYYYLYLKSTISSCVIPYLCGDIIFCFFYSTYNFLKVP